MPRVLARIAKSCGASLKPISCCSAWFSCTRRCSCARKSTMSYCRVTISTLSSRIKIRVSGIAAKTASMVGGLSLRARRRTVDSGLRCLGFVSRASSVRAAARTLEGTRLAFVEVRLPPCEAAVLAGRTAGWEAVTGSRRAARVRPEWARVEARLAPVEPPVEPVEDARVEPTAPGVPAAGREEPARRLRGAPWVRVGRWDACWVLTLLRFLSSTWRGCGSSRRRAAWRWRRGSSVRFPRR